MPNAREEKHPPGMDRRGLRHRTNAAIGRFIRPAARDPANASIGRNSAFFPALRRPGTDIVMPHRPVSGASAGRRSSRRFCPVWSTAWWRSPTRRRSRRPAWSAPFWGASGTVYGANLWGAFGRSPRWSAGPPSGSVRYTAFADSGDRYADTYLHRRVGQCPGARSGPGRLRHGGIRALLSMDVTVGPAVWRSTVQCDRLSLAGGGVARKQVARFVRDEEAVSFKSRHPDREIADDSAYPAQRGAAAVCSGRQHT